MRWFGILLLLHAVGVRVGLAGALLYTPFAVAASLRDLDVRVVAVCVAAAGVILWPVLPRWTRAIAPGLRLDPARHPRLFAALSEVAAASGQEMPGEVFLVSDMNAWVARRGGAFGVGSRRAMGLGLPLLQMLTVSQLRAVLAHEFGHFHGGDTALGPLVWRTRAAIERTLRGVAEHSAWLAKPFQWYGRLFIRAAHAVSRQQEFAADALAARLAGARPLVDGLKIIHGASAAFAPYWHSEVGPAIERGFRPPLAEGFRRFMAAPGVVHRIAREIERELTEGKTDPYDTHPPLRERVAAVAALPPVVGATDDAPALSLLEDLEGVERALLHEVVRDDLRDKLRPARWEELGERVWVPLWREQASERAPFMRGITPLDFPRWAEDLSTLAARLGLAAFSGVARDPHRRHAGHVLGAALASALAARGWRVTALPGDAVRFERDGKSVQPFSVLALADGEVKPDEWRRQCEDAGIGGVDLGEAARC
jgi:Zn-dependent protease with chaperone function